jgi:hypothetical protein
VVLSFVDTFIKSWYSLSVEPSKSCHVNPHLEVMLFYVFMDV